MKLWKVQKFAGDVVYDLRNRKRSLPVIAVLWVFISYAVFRTVPNAALSEEERLTDVDEHVMVSVEKEQVGDETHPHIHVTRSRRADGSERVELRVDDHPSSDDDPRPRGAEGQPG